MTNNQQYLKDNLTSIEIETFSYCNRTCSFCPNSFIDRHSHNIEMDSAIYLSILRQLRDINYSKIISFSRYNEPLAYRCVILDRIATAREYVPNAKLHTNTNGDYITDGYLKCLHKSGLNSLHIQAYIDGEWNADDANTLIDKMIHKLNLKGNFRDGYVRSKGITFESRYEDMKILLYSRDFNNDGCSRGDSIDIRKKYVRKSRCIQPSKGMYIDYNNKAMMCCNVRSDIPEHEHCIVGDVSTDKLADIFNSEKINKIRAELNKSNIQITPCNSCSFGL